MTKIFSILSLLFFLPLYIFAQDTIPAEKIKRMMEVMGSAQRFEVVIETLIEQQRDEFSSSYSDEFFDQFKTSVMSDGYKNIIELLVPIYQKYLTEGEIDAIIEFYETTAGQSMVKKFPLITQESMNVGQTWGENLAKEISTRIMNAKEVRFEAELVNCGNFKEGRFYYQLPDGTEVNVEREGLIQKEIVEAKTLISKIEWISECRYKIWELDDDMVTIDQEPLVVNIYEVTDTSYKFVSHRKGDEFYGEGELVLKQ